MRAIRTYGLLCPNRHTGPARAHRALPDPRPRGLSCANPGATPRPPGFVPHRGHGRRFQPYPVEPRRARTWAGGRDHRTELGSVGLSVRWPLRSAELAQQRVVGLATRDHGRPCLGTLAHDRDVRAAPGRQTAVFVRLQWHVGVVIGAHRPRQSLHRSEIGGSRPHRLASQIRIAHVFDSTGVRTDRSSPMCACYTTILVPNPAIMIEQDQQPYQQVHNGASNRDADGSWRSDMARWAARGIRLRPPPTTCRLARSSETRNGAAEARRRGGVTMFTPVAGSPSRALAPIPA